MAQDGNGRNSDRNGSSGSSLLLWAGLIVATGLLLIFYISPWLTRELSVNDLKELIQANGRVEVGGERKPGAPGFIDVRDKNKVYRYSELKSAVVIHERSLTGTVEVAELTPQGTGDKLVADGKTFREVAFRTSIDPNGKNRDEIITLLDQNNIKYKYAGGPTNFETQAPWIVVGFVAIVLVYFMLR